MAEIAGLPPRRPGRPADEDLAKRRDAAVMAEQSLDASVTSDTVVLAGVPCVLCAPPTPRGVIVHLHGGGYRLGKAEAWRPFAARLAAASGFTVLAPDYGLAPEHPFPAALHDSLGVMAEAREATGCTALILSGDSAGGGLAMASLVAAPHGGVLGVALISPWLDLTVSAGTYESRAATDTRFSATSARQAAELYLQGHPATDPLVSPLFADFAEPPPALIMASTTEVLLQDSLSLAERLAKAGGDVELHTFPGQIHDWPVLHPHKPAAARAISLMAVFANRVIGA